MTRRGPLGGGSGGGRGAGGSVEAKLEKEGRVFRKLDANIGLTQRSFVVRFVGTASQENRCLTV